MNKKFLPVVASCLLALFCAACGVEQGGDHPGADAPATEDTDQETAPASVVEPPGIIYDNISVPDAVLAAAREYVRGEYDYWVSSTGCYAMVDGEKQMVGEPAAYDNWRIESLELACQYTDLGGMNLDVYRLGYRIHTTTPDKVRAFLAGGMDLDGEGWLLPSYPDSDYLVFSVSGEREPAFLLHMMENDCSPGDEPFTSDLARLLDN